MWEEIKKPLIWTGIIVLILYSLMSFYSYKGIRIKEERLNNMQLKIEEKVKNDEKIDYNIKRDFNDELEVYERQQNLLQSFWMKWIFEFDKFEKK